jgi:hypothetical protein
VITFHPTYPGRMLDMQVLGEREIAIQSVKVIDSEPLRSLPHRGLDGVTMQRFKVLLVPGAGEQEQPFVAAAE